MDGTHGTARRRAARFLRVALVGGTLLTASVGVTADGDVASATRAPVRCIRVYGVGNHRSEVLVPCPGEPVVVRHHHPTGRLTLR